jgi:cysteine desulfurase / selenocysteine lyase
VAEVSGVDFLVASGYKWLCGIHGLGIIYARPEFLQDLNPGSLGWYSIENMFSPDRFVSYSLKPDASRLQSGMPHFPAMYALNASVDYLNHVGLEKLEKSLLPLMRRLYQGLVELRVDVLTPPEEMFWSGIMAFASADAETTGRALAAKGVVVWCGDGRVRTSVHLYNDANDVDMFLGALRNVLDGRTP